MQPEQVYKQSLILKERNVDLAELEKAPLFLLCELIQRCVVGPASNALLFPGAKGAARLMALPPTAIISTAKMVIDFQELSQEAPCPFEE
jgi:hypothetical protein